jgi:NADPH2:quinone reductase
MTAELPKQAAGIVVEKFDDWRYVKFGTLPLRPLREGEILLRCEAAALNFQDLLMIEGKYQFKPSLPFIAGSDIAGRIAAVGPRVEEFAINQPVAALAQSGAFADYAIVRASRCFPLPEEIDRAKAAAATSIFATVVVALRIRGQLKPGERVLVTGAAGGVGVAAVQFARQIGAEVIALVSSEAKEQLVKNAGAHHVLRLDRMDDAKQDLRPGLEKLGVRGVDMVVDMVSGDVFDGAIRCLQPNGRLVVVGFASGQIAEVKTNYILLKGISVVGSALRFGLEQDGPEIKYAMSQIYEDIVRGRLDPFITATFPMIEFRRAAAMIADRSAVGKIVLIPDQR